MVYCEATLVTKQLRSFRQHLFQPTTSRCSLKEADTHKIGLCHNHTFRIRQKCTGVQQFEVQRSERLLAQTSLYSAGNGAAFLGVGRGVKLTTHLHLIPRLRMSGVMILLPRTYSWRAERLHCIGCAKWDVLLKRLKRGPDFWDIMMPLFRVGHYFRNILRMEQIVPPKFWKLFTRYMASDPRWMDSFIQDNS